MKGVVEAEQACFDLPNPGVVFGGRASHLIGVGVVAFCCTVQLPGMLLLLLLLMLVVVLVVVMLLLLLSQYLIAIIQSVVTGQPAIMEGGGKQVEH